MKLTNELPFYLILQSLPIANKLCFNKQNGNSLASFIYRWIQRRSYVGSSRCGYYSQEPSRPSALFYSLNSNNSKYLVVGIAVCDDKWDAKLMILNGPRNTMVYSLIIIICMYIPRRAFLGNSGCCVCIPRCCRCVYIYSLLWFQTLQFL